MEVCAQPARAGSPCYGVVVLAVLGLLVMGSGCTSYIAPPAAGQRWASVYLADYGKHTSVLFIDQGKLTEYAFGDFNWFALNKNSPVDGIIALLFSPGSGLGRRQMEIPAADANMAQYIRARRVIGFFAPGDRVEAVAKGLDEQFRSHLDTVHYNPRIGLWFVRVGERYWLFHNCNHVTARWLREMGCRVSGLTVTSDFRVREEAAGRATVWWGSKEGSASAPTLASAPGGGPGLGGQRP